MTLDAGSVVVKLSPAIATAGCWIRLSAFEVTHGVIEPAVRPFNLNATGMSAPFWLIATITKPPVAGFLYADTDTPPGDPLTPATTKPGRTNLLKLPTVYNRLVSRELPLYPISPSLSAFNPISHQ